VVQVRVGVGTGRWSVLLQVLLRMLQVVCSRGVASTYRALLEVALQDVTTTERVLAQMALVGSLAGI
jgi:hypothetical protein